MRRVTYDVPNIDCQRCARTIERGLTGADGIRRVTVDVAAKRVVVDYDSDWTTRKALEDRLEGVGFPPGDTLDERELPEATADEPAVAAPPREATPGRAWYWLLALGVLALALAGYTGYVLYPRFGLPAVEGATLLLLATGAGIASFFSPCSFPLLVTLLARQVGAEAPRETERAGVGRTLPFAAALSFGAASFLLFSGLIIALGGEALFAGVTFTSTAGRIIRAVVGVLLILLGLMQIGVLPFSLHVVEHVSKPLMRSQAQYRRTNPMLGFTILGFGYVLAGFG